jgi:hypothetical protein
MKHWFTPKWFGYGFRPVTWEGWLVTLFFVFLIMGAAYASNFFTVTGPTPQEGVRFIVDIIVMSGVFTALFEKRCKGGLRWRWGRNS